MRKNTPLVREGYFGKIDLKNTAEIPVIHMGISAVTQTRLLRNIAII